jgi:uncharacterized membrane protein
MDGQNMSKHSFAENKAAPFDDHKMESLMGRLLQVGVLFASSFVLLGGIFFLKDNAGTVANYRVFKGQPADLLHLKSLLVALVHGRREAIIQLGILLLIATPVARVVFAVFAFALERDKLYVAISLIVLAVLLVGLCAS